jgi:ribose-phosphate pyrophosphokinase
MLAANAVTKLRSSGVSRIVGSDTIERGCSVVTVAAVIADALA